MKKLNENIFINDPGDDEKSKREKTELEKKLDPRNHQYLEIWHGGNKYSVPLKDFIAKHGDPQQYSSEDLKKYVMQTWMKKSLG